MYMDNADIDKRNETRRASLAKARQVLANERAAERERVFAKSAARVADAPSRAATEFEGLTATECCDDCHPDGCVVSGSWYCAHPMKTGLSAADKGDHVKLKRFKRAKDFLKDAKLDLQKMSE
jgi:hypothetical protein